MQEMSIKPVLPVHVILGANEYTKIKMAGYQRAGKIGEPVAEQTRFGWTIMTTGAEANLESMFLTQTAVADYEQLCRLDVLGLQDTPPGDQKMVHAEFVEQLRRSPEGWYETGIPWKGDHPPLPNNKTGSLKRLESLVAKLKRTGNLEAYDAIIREQLESGVIEPADEPAKGKEFYIPHKPVIRENAESTKLRIVYDASAKANATAPSLNECLNIGPPLQNQLWKVLVRARFRAVAIIGDMKKAFLQVRIREEDRDALRFHWINPEKPDEIKTYRFTRALFGLGPSPFLLGGVIQQHLNTYRDSAPKCVEEIEHGLYVDDLLLGGDTIEEARVMKTAAIEIFEKAHFQLHKWNSNASELEDDTQATNTNQVSESVQQQEVIELAQEEQVSESSLTYAKQQLGVKSGDSRLLGLEWAKHKDTLAIKFPQEPTPVTKRGILQKIAKVYDPLGLASPLNLQGKLLYRDACNVRGAWDAELPDELCARWRKWEKGLPVQVEVPRALVRVGEPIKDIALHAFGDASGCGVAAAVYAVVQQGATVNQGLVVARARLAKQGLTIPRLELVSGHMAVNLLSNVRDALDRLPVGSLYAWLDSTVALHWIAGNGEYKQFVSNRVSKIKEHKEVSWRHVPTQDNPADLGSRGGLVSDDNQLWWKGPDWLSDPSAWPPEIITTPTAETESERKALKQVLATAKEEPSELNQLLHRTTLWRTLRICAWVYRFMRNSRCHGQKDKVRGPLTTEEIEYQRTLWTKRVQRQHAELQKFKEERLKLNLHPNDDGVLVCHGRIQGEYPIYVPYESVLAEKLIQDAHKSTLHGGVGLTMTKVRERYWIPHLRRLVKRTIKACAGCKRFQAVAFKNPPAGPLPKDRTEGNTPFEVIGVDYAGPLEYKATKKKTGKAYVLLYTCSLTRAIHLELLPTLETQDFIKSFKAFVARRGRPKKVYSDNGGTFVGAERWLRKVMDDEKFNDILARNNIVWQFNLSRAPWWGGQFERLVGLMKQALQKSIGRGLLTWKELEELLLDVEVALNGRPLSYVEDDHQLPILTPNVMLYTQSNLIPELDLHRVEDADLRKRAKYLQRCKQVLWNRWTSEYVRALREQHNLKHGSNTTTLAEGDVVIIRGDEKDRNKWKLGIVKELIKGRDGILRAAKLRSGRGFLERAVQQLYPLKLRCDAGNDQRQPPQPIHQVGIVRPRRAAAETARQRIHADADNDEL